MASMFDELFAAGLVDQTDASVTLIDPTTGTKYGSVPAKIKAETDEALRDAVAELGDVTADIKIRRKAERGGKKVPVADANGGVAPCAAVAAAWGARMGLAPRSAASGRGRRRAAADSNGVPADSNGVPADSNGVPADSNGAAATI